MPVEGLPSAVETIMVQMLEENILSSWKVTGGQQYATISLHFKVNMADQPGMTSHTGIRQYRTKPPSAVKRDKKRLDTLKSRQEVQNYGHLDNENSQKDITFQSEGTKDTAFHIATQTEERSHTPVLYNVDGQSVDMVGLHSSDPDHRYDTTQQLDINSASTCAGIQTLDHEDVQLDITDSEDDFQNTGMCFCCEKDIKSGMWWKCTSCVSDICEDCVENGKHHKHQDQLHKFVKPANQDSYCDSCGLEFKTRQARYYMCVSCDNYALCQKCMKENMHKHHQLTMRCRSDVT